MQFLIIGAHIEFLTNIVHIANTQRVHALFIQRGNEMRGLLVLTIPDVMVLVPQLFLLRVDQFLASW